MLKGAFHGWRGVLLTAVAGALLVGGGLAAAVVSQQDYEGVRDIIRTEPGGVRLPGQLRCRVAEAAPRPVDSPRGAVSVATLRQGEVVALASDGSLWRGDPTSGALAPWEQRPDVGGLGVGAPSLVLADALRRDVLVVGSAGVAALDGSTGEELSRQPLPAGSEVVGAAATNRVLFLVTSDGGLLESRWAYRRLDALEPVELRDVPAVRRVIASRDGERLLAVTDGPLVRVAVATGGGQAVPVGDVVPAATLTQAHDGLVYLADGERLRVLDLNERWVTGRLSGPVDGWTTPVAALAGVPEGLLVVDGAGALTLAPYPVCNREELTRLGEGGPTP